MNFDVELERKIVNIVIELRESADNSNKYGSYEELYDLAADLIEELRKLLREP